MRSHFRPAFCSRGCLWCPHRRAVLRCKHPEKLTGLGLFDVSLTPPVEQTGQRETGRPGKGKCWRKQEKPAVELQKYWRFYENRDAAFKTHTAHQGEADMSERTRGPGGFRYWWFADDRDMNLAEAQRIADNIPGAGLSDNGDDWSTVHHFYRPGLFTRIVCGI